MNKVLVVIVTGESHGNLTTGGIEMGTEQGVREALALARFAEAQLTERLIELRVQAVGDGSNDS